MGQEVHLVENNTDYLEGARYAELSGVTHCCCVPVVDYVMVCRCVGCRRMSARRHVFPFRMNVSANGDTITGSSGKRCRFPPAEMFFCNPVIYSSTPQHASRPGRINLLTVDSFQAQHARLPNQPRVFISHSIQTTGHSLAFG